MGIGVRLCSPFNPYTSMAPWTTDYADKYITGFDNEEFDKLQYDCVYGELLNDPKAKIAALNRMEELLLGEVAFIPLCRMTTPSSTTSASGCRLRSSSPASAMAGSSPPSKIRQTDVLNCKTG